MGCSRLTNDPPLYIENVEWTLVLYKSLVILVIKEVLLLVLSIAIGLACCLGIVGSQLGCNIVGCCREYLMLLLMLLLLMLEVPESAERCFLHLKQTFTASSTSIPILYKNRVAAADAVAADVGSTRVC